ncbi:MAG: hypothetical protein KDE20_06495 [Caldilineaceae bacterium]|nr:hypothetical protein [Caldilineaceae bacterium]
MTDKTIDIYVGADRMQVQSEPVAGDYVDMLGETYYRIRNYDQMAPFFMSLVSSTDHWLFISSTGGLTAGRIDAESALFPYETDDKLAAGSEQTGPKTLIQATRAGRTQLWEPFSLRYAGLYRCQRNLYKNVFGNKLIFEEVNHDLQLTYRYAWRTSDRFGFVKSSWLENHGPDACQVALIDGLQNIMPYGTTTLLQTTMSNLLNAYKRNEIDPATGLGIFALSATLTDRAEPSESLMSTVAWQVGLDPVRHLLSPAQLDDFRHGRPIVAEDDVRGRAGAYFVSTELSLAPGATRHWHIVSDVNQDSRAVADLVRRLDADGAQLQDQLETDIVAGTDALVRYVAAADGLQQSADEAVSAHHFANVLFNIMRGGIFADNYRCDKRDFVDFIRTRNRPMAAIRADWFAALPAEFDIQELYARAAAAGDADLARLCYEYLPLMFSRRHGDPSRPWNRFAIHLRQADGSVRLYYQGNWRDIFQNWEPLLWSFPGYIGGVIAKFLNATTADGYNPYRVTRDGIEWEVPEPHNPWANIGYWSDHQIIYLQKLLEMAQEVEPALLPDLWNRPVFAYADVPYRLHTYTEMLADWYNTIDFDGDAARAVEARVAAMGTDGRLRRDADGAIVHITLTEKLLVLLLAKLTNLVPEGGIWMNTQRPEWNDANNALVGKGLSVVTTAYLRRFIAFWTQQLAANEAPSYAVSAAVVELMAAVQDVFARHRGELDAGFTDQSRRAVMDALGAASTAYRAAIYTDAHDSAQVDLAAATLRDFLALALDFVEQTLRANRRADDLYHAYNILRVEEGRAGVEHLYVMLEGQVAILSSGLLSAAEALALLQSLRHSDLYRADQHTYMLYPNRTLPGFLEKNVVRPAQVEDSALVRALTAADDRRLLSRDAAGNYHFHGSFRNAGDVAATLDTLAQDGAYAPLVAAERDVILDLFETTFNHSAFTGRSGTFFAFEGLGSIYWHMVAKLLLAVQECYMAARDQGADQAIIDGLAAAYYDIRQGLGFNKSPAVYGAFPTDPYSHTPEASGARQPGMTGQVKEEILTRWGELGVTVRDGAFRFAPTLLHREEFTNAAGSFAYRDVHGDAQTLPLPADSLAFTVCQTPVVYTRGAGAAIRVTYADGTLETVAGDQLPRAMSEHILARDNRVRWLHVTVV